MKKLITVLSVIVLLLGLTIALKADDSMTNAGNTMNSMAAPTIVATAVSATGGMAVMTTQNNGPTTVGGQIKLTLFTAVDGVSTTGAKLSNLTKKGSTEYEGFAFNDLWLFIGHQISDVVSVEIEPEISASTGATPKIGSSIGTQLNAGSIGFSGFNKAYVRYDAPYGFEISGGIVKPILTMDYGEELFWDEEFYGSKFAANSVLGEDDNIGIEVYKALNIGDASLPVWLYCLNNNASNEVAGNNQPAGMIHIEPEYGMFKLSGSYEAGTWDGGKRYPFQRASGGLVFDWQNLQLRGEYAGGKWNEYLSLNSGGPLIDQISQGYYAKAIYKLTDWLKLIYDHSDAYQLTSISTGAQRYITNTLMVDWSMAPSAYLMFQLDYANWYDVSGLGTLNFIRPTLATRVTF